MDEETVITATIQDVVTGAVYALAGLQHLILADPDAARQWASAYLKADASYEGPTPAIAEASRGAARYILLLANQETARRKVEEDERREPSFLAMLLPPSDLLN